MHQFLIGLALALVLVGLSYYFSFLSVSGSVATFILAVIIFGLGGWPWAIPILTFFILSSLLSKLGKSKKQRFKDTFEKTGKRDYGQVIANGGLAGLFTLAWFVTKNDMYYSFYVVSLAAVNADTWATELGVLFSSHPRLITNFKRVAPGISGAVSIPGSLAALFGSFVVALSGYIFIGGWAWLLLVTLAGFAGSVIDSFLGALFQAQYQCTVCEKFTEKNVHCQNPSRLISGHRWLNNDWVNILAALISVLLFLLIF